MTDPDLFDPDDWEIVARPEMTATPDRVPASAVVYDASDVPFSTVTGVAVTILNEAMSEYERATLWRRPNWFMRRWQRWFS